MHISQAVLQITSDLTELVHIRRFLRAFCEIRIGPALDEGRFSQLELALNEAVANVIKHAYHGRPGRPIRLEASDDEDRIILRLYHYGTSFSPEGVAPPAFDGSRDGGFGVYLIDRCVDEVRYTRDEQGRNCIYLMKRLVGL